MFAVNVAVVSLVFVPYYLFIRLGQQEYRRINREFSGQVKQHNLKIDQMERWNLNALGIDFKQQKLLFVQRRNEKIFVQLYDLGSIKACRESFQNTTIQVNGANVTILQKVDLELIPYSGEAVTVINLFNNDMTYNEEFELDHARKWKELVNQCICARPAFKKVA